MRDCHTHEFTNSAEVADFLVMAKHKTVAANNLVLTWNRVASKHLWDRGLFWFAATIFGAATFFMDFLRTENGSWLWAITYSLSPVSYTHLTLPTNREV